MVLTQNEDFARISRSYPDLDEHQDYDPEADFPQDLSGLLPPSADRWWEHLGKWQYVTFPYPLPPRL